MSSILTVISRQLLRYVQGNRYLLQRQENEKVVEVMSRVDVMPHGVMSDRAGFTCEGGGGN
jgi:hypothetical protein